MYMNTAWSTSQWNYFYKKRKQLDNFILIIIYIILLRRNHLAENSLKSKDYFKQKVQYCVWCFTCLIINKLQSSRIDTKASLKMSCTNFWQNKINEEPQLDLSCCTWQQTYVFWHLNFNFNSKIMFTTVWKTTDWNKTH